MVDKQSVCLRQLGEGRAGEVRFGRFLANARVNTDALVEAACAGVAQRSAGRHVLLIEDTTELNYQAHAKRVAGLGTVGNGTDLGFFLHPVLVVDADVRACLGLAHLHLWQRRQGKAANYQALPIETKESYRWIHAIEVGRQCLPQAARMTVVADREADIFELWTRLPDARTDLLIRAGRDRALYTEGRQRLFEWLASQPLGGQYRLRLPAVAGKRSGHEALLNVRFAQVRLSKPRHCTDARAPKALTLNAIEVVEDAQTVVADEAPIHWRLLTTHTVRTLAQARQCIDWYCQRWHIEQLFRILKRQGLDVESSQIEHGERLQKLAVLATAAAVRTLQLTLAREGQAPRPASDAFSAEEIDLLHDLQPTLEGKTEKQKNPHPPNTLAWAAWIIARLGGWKGYASERKPGPITFLHGLREFSSILVGWRLARRLGVGDVCIH